MRSGMRPPVIAPEPEPEVEPKFEHRKAYSHNVNRVTITIDARLVEEVDALRLELDHPPSRSLWIIEAMQEKLARANMKKRKAIQELEKKALAEKQKAVKAFLKGGSIVGHQKI